MKRIYYNLLTAILLLLFIFTSINSQILDGRNLSRTGFLMLNLLNFAFLVKLIKYLLNLFVYFNKRSKLRSFLTNFKIS